MIIGYDYETHLFGPENLAPTPVCLSTYINDGPQRWPEDVFPEDEGTEIATAADGDLDDLLGQLLDAACDGTPIVAQNAAFDLAVACTHGPQGTIDRVYEALSLGTIKDTLVREKLLDLADDGDLNYHTFPDGTKRKKSQLKWYSLGKMVQRYLAVEMEGKVEIKKGQVVGEADAWRLNYNVLEDVSLCDWPDDAIEYSAWDSIYVTLIYRHQEDRRADLQRLLGIDPLKTEGFRAALAFSLFLMSMRGVPIDAEKKAEIEAMLADTLKPENLVLLVEHEIMRPEQLPRPHARGARAHETGCDKKGCDCPPKMTKGKKASINTKKLKAHILTLLEELGEESVKIRYTPESEKFPKRAGYPEGGQVSTDMEFLDDHYHLCPVLGQYRDRMKVNRLVTTELPRMEWEGKTARVVHPCFDPLKETGRISSYGGDAYPSFNCQQIDPRVRGCFVPLDGYYLYSVDYVQMELGTTAQKTLELFGSSILADQINAGWDTHAALGSSLALHLDDDFRELCVEEGIQSSAAQVYRAFMECLSSDEESIKKFGKKFRTFAKPTGLGYVGALGPETFIKYAHSTFGVTVDLETATELKEIWRATYPNMVRYHQWINSSCVDPHNVGDDGRPLYSYLTPLGMYRAGAKYCAAANGIAMQSPAAEGALMGTVSVVQETYSTGGTLGPDDLGERHIPLMFVHDELIGMARIDVAHEVAHEVARLMIASMRIITPDVTPRAVPVLMRRWNKSAEPVCVNKRLVPWEEPE